MYTASTLLQCCCQRQNCRQPSLCGLHCTPVNALLKDSNFYGDGVKAFAINNCITCKLHLSRNTEPFLRVSAIVYSHLQGVPIYSTKQHMQLCLIINSKIHNARILLQHQYIASKTLKVFFKIVVLDCC